MTYWANSFKLFTHEVCAEGFDSEDNIYVYWEGNQANGSITGH